MKDDSNIMFESFSSKPKVKKGRTLALWGVYLQLGAAISMIVAAIRMDGTFGKGGSATALAENISIAISIPTFIAFVLFHVGLVFLMVALFKSKYRAPWFFWLMTINAALILFEVPVGTILGTIIFVYIIPKKDEFIVKPPQMGTTSPRHCSTFD